MPLPRSASSKSSLENNLVNLIAGYRQALIIKNFALDQTIKHLCAHSGLPDSNSLTPIRDEIFFAHFVEVALAAKWASMLGLDELCKSLIKYQAKNKGIQAISNSEERSAKVGEFINALKKLDISTVKENEERKKLLTRKLLEQFEAANKAYTAFSEFADSPKGKKISDSLRIMRACNDAWTKQGTIGRLELLTPEMPEEALFEHHDVSSKPRPKTPKGDQEFIGEGIGSVSPPTPSSGEMRAKARLRRSSRIASITKSPVKGGEFLLSSESDSPAAVKELSKELENTKDKLEATNEQWEEDRGKNTQLRDELREALLARDQFERKYTTAQEERKRKQETINELRDKIAAQEEEMDRLSKQIEKLEKQVEAEKRKCSDAYGLVKDMNKNQEEQDRIIKNLKKESERLSRDNAALRKVVDIQEAELKEYSASTDKYYQLAQEGEAAAAKKQELELANQSLEKKLAESRAMFPTVQDLTKKLQTTLARIENQDSATSVHLPQTHPFKLGCDGMQKLSSVIRNLDNLSKMVGKVASKVQSLEEKQGELENTLSTYEAPTIVPDRYTASPSPFGRSSNRHSLGSIPSSASAGMFTPPPLSRRNTGYFGISRSDSVSSVGIPTSRSANSVYSVATDYTRPDLDPYNKAAITHQEWNGLQRTLQELSQKYENFSNKFTLQDSENTIHDAEYHFLTEQLELEIGQFQENIEILDTRLIKLEHTDRLQALKQRIEDIRKHLSQLVSLRVAQEIFEQLKAQCEKYLAEQKDLGLRDKISELGQIFEMPCNDKGAENIPYIAKPWIEIRADFQGEIYQKFDIFSEQGRFEWKGNALDITTQQLKEEKKEQAILKLYRKERASNSAEQAAFELKETILSIVHLILATAEKNPKMVVTLAGEVQVVHQLVGYLQAAKSLYSDFSLKAPDFVLKTPQIKVAPQFSEEQLKKMKQRIQRENSMINSDEPLQATSCLSEELKAAADAEAIPSATSSLVSGY